MLIGMDKAILHELAAAFCLMRLATSNSVFWGCSASESDVQDLENVCPTHTLEMPFLFAA